MAAEDKGTPEFRAFMNDSAPNQMALENVRAMEVPTDEECKAVAQAMDIEGKFDWTSTDHDQVEKCTAAIVEAERFILGVRAVEALGAGKLKVEQPPAPEPDPTVEGVAADGNPPPEITYDAQGNPVNAAASPDYDPEIDDTPQNAQDAVYPPPPVQGRPAPPPV